MPDPATPLDVMIASQLPGLGECALPAPCEDAELERLPVHTASRLRESDPARYAQAAALFFGCGLGIREICRVLRLSPHTLGMIITAESNGRTADQWRSELCASLRAVGSLSASAMRDLLLDQDAVEIAGIKGVATAIDKIAHAHELLDGRPTDRRENLAKPSTSDAATAYLAALKSATEVKPMDYAGGKEEVARAEDEADEAGEVPVDEVQHD